MELFAITLAVGIAVVIASAFIRSARRGKPWPRELIEALIVLRADPASLELLRDLSKAERAKTHENRATPALEEDARLVA